MRTETEGGIRRRTKLLAVGCGLWILVIVARLVQLQVFEHARLEIEVRDQNRNQRTVLPRRGAVLDRNGHILARSLPVSSAFLRADRGETEADQAAKIEALAPILELGAGDRARILQQVRDGDSFIWLKRKIDDAAVLRVRNLKLKGVYFETENRRTYPQGRLAAHALGWVDVDGVGQAGVEFAYDRSLAGEPGKQLILLDARRRGYQIETLKAARPGTDLVLTIDTIIQYIAERELERTLGECGGGWGTVIVMSPESGEIMAMASAPGFDPNAGAPAPELRRNAAVHQNYEPGSTFKLVTTAAALETGRVGFGDVFDCSAGSLVAGGTVIRDYKRYGILSFSEIITESSNVGTALVARRVGAPALYEEIRKFRFGDLTGIDLPGEEDGILHPLAEWNRASSLEHIAIGYEMTATPLQILRAMNVYAAGGRLVRPRIARRADVMGPEPPVRQVLPQALAEEITRRIFARVVEEGTGVTARLEGFEVAGKTGTTQKIESPRGGYSTSRHIASFVGFVTADRPVFSMIVVIDEPQGVLQYGGQVAAPAFREIATRILRYLRVPPHGPAAGQLATARLQGGRP
jgi:cell division protein FtsI/penicillin-binding protein 2